MPKPRRPPALAAALPLALLAAPHVAGTALALDFGALPIAYEEDFIGEAAPPTSPEVDVVGAGALAVDGTLTGSAAHFDLPGALDPVDTATAVVDPDIVSTVGSDLGARAEFDSFALTQDGEVGALVSLFLTQPAAAVPFLQIDAGIRLTRAGATYSALLAVTESAVGGGPALSSVTVVLSASDALAIGTGAAFRIDMLLDDSAKTVVASLDIGGVPTATTPVHALTAFEAPTLSLLVGAMGITTGSPDPRPASIDLGHLALFTQVETYQPFINVDVSDAQNVPSIVYPAAGGAGCWNDIGPSPTALLDVGGAASGVTIDLDSQFITVGEGASPPNDVRLLADYGSSCLGTTPWSLVLTGLPVDSYRIRVYAPSDANTVSGSIDFDGVPVIGSLPGSSTSTLVQGTSWDVATTVQTDGSLTITGSDPGGCRGVSGIQIERALPPPSVPSLGGPALRWLAAALAVSGWWMRSRVR